MSFFFVEANPEESPLSLRKMPAEDDTKLHRVCGDYIRQTEAVLRFIDRTVNGEVVAFACPKKYKRFPRTAVNSTYKSIAGHLSPRNPGRKIQRL